MVEPDSPVLDVRRRVAVFVALAAVVVTWFILAPHVPWPGVWPAVVIIAAGVMPATLLFVYLALPLSRLPLRVLVTAALLLGLVALGCSEAGWGLPENFAKLAAATFAGWAFLNLFYEVGLVVLIAAIIPVVDAVSVFTPHAPTHEIIAHHPQIYTDVAVAFLGPRGVPASLGPPDILFYALFIAAALRFGLRPGWTWIATTGMYGLTIVITTAANLSGLPALPFLSAGFFLANGDLLWQRLRPRRA